MKVKYLPYPPLVRVRYHCPDCTVTAVVFTHYPAAYQAHLSHRCPKTNRIKELVRA